MTHMIWVEFELYERGEDRLLVNPALVAAIRSAGSEKSVLKFAGGGEVWVRGAAIIVAEKLSGLHPPAVASKIPINDDDDIPF